MEHECGYEHITLHKLATSVDADDVRRAILSAQLVEEHYVDGELDCVHVTLLGAAVLTQLLFVLYKDNIELALALNETSKFNYMYDVAKIDEREEMIMQMRSIFGPLFGAADNDEN